MSNARIAFLIIGLVAFGVAGLFFWQNSLRTVRLSIDLGVVASQTQPIPVVYLLGGSFAVGFVAASIAWLGRAAAANRRVRQLEQQIALSESGSTSEYR